MDWSVKNILELLAEKWEAPCAALTAYEYTPGNIPREIRSSWFSDLLKNGSNSAGIEIFPANYFVWSDEMAGAFTYDIDVTIGGEAASEAHLKLIWQPVLGELEPLIEECEDFSELESPAESTPHVTQNRFILNGDYWSITYKGETKILINTKGLRYIDYLIQRQGKEVRALELYYAINPPDNEFTDPTHSVMTADQLWDEGLSVEDLGNSGRTMDQKAIAAIKQEQKRLTDGIEIAKETGNTVQQQKLENERSNILQYFTPDLGLNGEPRKVADNHKRMVDGVSKCIRKDISRIKKALPELGEHLSCIKKGATYKYAPSPTMDW